MIAETRRSHRQGVPNNPKNSVPPRLRVDLVPCPPSPPCSPAELDGSRLFRLNLRTPRKWLARERARRQRGNIHRPAGRANVVVSSTPHDRRTLHHVSERHAGRGPGRTGPGYRSDGAVSGRMAGAQLVAGILRAAETAGLAGQSGKSGGQRSSGLAKLSRRRSRRSPRGRAPQATRRSGPSTASAPDRHLEGRPVRTRSNGVRAASGLPSSRRICEYSRSPPRVETGRGRKASATVNRGGTRQIYEETPSVDRRSAPGRRRTRLVSRRA